MRTFGYILTFFITYGAVFYAQVDICNITNSCASSIESCDEVTSHQDSSTANEFHHEHCNTHCGHHFFYYRVPSILSFAYTDFQYHQSYSFYYNSTILEGPFRPPLV